MVWITLALLAWLPHARAQSSPPSVQSELQQLPAASGLSSYQGLNVRDIAFPGLSESDQKLMGNLIAQKSGQPFDRDKVRESMQVLYATGRFADVRVEAQRAFEERLARQTVAQVLETAREDLSARLA